MRSHSARIVAAIVLLTILVCPLVEIFDHWDHALETGNETEYALFTAALCIGLAFPAMRAIVRFVLLRFLGILVARDENAVLFVPLRSASLGSDTLSPPPLSLRI
jgi:hypothetical protein